MSTDDNIENSADEEDYSITSMRFKSSFWDRVKICAIKRHMTATELVERSINNFLKDDDC